MPNSNNLDNLMGISTIMWKDHVLESSGSQNHTQSCCSQGIFSFCLVVTFLLGSMKKGSVIHDGICVYEVCVAVDDCQTIFYRFFLPFFDYLIFFSWWWHLCVWVCEVRVFVYDWQTVFYRFLKTGSFSHDGDSICVYGCMRYVCLSMIVKNISYRFYHFFSEKSPDFFYSM